MEKLYGRGKGIITLPEKIEIPPIDDKRLEELYQLLKPIVTLKRMKYLLRELTLQELRELSFISNKDLGEVIDSSKLEIVDDFLIFHSLGTYGGDMPPIAEILAQVPDGVIKEANAFEIIESPRTRDDIFKYDEVMAKHLHLSKARAYKMHR